MTINIHSPEQFYQRQTSLSEVGVSGQLKLTNSKVLIIGAGGLGCPVLEYLTAAGVGKIVICDFDKVDYSNLHRQVLFTPKHVGSYKAEVAALRLREQNPHIKIDTHLQKFDLGFQIENFDLVLDCSDNFKTKFMAHDLCYKNKVPLIQASIHKFEGQIQVFKYTKDLSQSQSACLRCLWPKSPKKNCVQTCSEAGVLGVVPGVLGTMQANEAIKYLLGLPTLNTAETLIVNLLNFSTQKIKWSKSPDCPLCSSSHLDLSHLDYGESSLEKSYDQLKVNYDQYTFIYLASSEQSKIKVTINSSVENIVEDTKGIHKETPIIVFCNYGISSYKATELLRAEGYNNSFSLKDGLKGI